MVTVKAPRQIIDVGVVRSADSPVTVPTLHEGSPAPGALVVEQGAAKGNYKQVLIQLEVLYLALLDLESDQLKLHALPTGAPLREQVSEAESLHLSLLHQGLSRPGFLADCLAVPKGRTLVIRCLPHLAHHRAVAVCSQLLASLHLLARGETLDTRVWLVLSHHIKTQSCEALEPPVRAIVSRPKKVVCKLLATPLGSTTLLALLLKEGVTGSASGVWSQLASIILTCAAEGAAIAATIVKLELDDSSLDRVLNLTDAQKAAWQRIQKSVPAS